MTSSMYSTAVKVSPWLKSHWVFWGKLSKTNKRFVPGDPVFPPVAGGFHVVPVLLSYLVDFSTALESLRWAADGLVIVDVEVGNREFAFLPPGGGRRPKGQKEPGGVRCMLVHSIECGDTIGKWSCNVMQMFGF